MKCVGIVIMFFVLVPLRFGWAQESKSQFSVTRYFDISRYVNKESACVPRNSPVRRENTDEVFRDLKSLYTNCRPELSNARVVTATVQETGAHITLCEMTAQCR